MAIDVLQKEIDGLPDSDIKLLIEFVRFLKFQKGETAPLEGTSGRRDIKKRRRGFLADAFISISPDFDETPESMGEYA